MNPPQQLAEAAEGGELNLFEEMKVIQLALDTPEQGKQPML